MAGFNLALGHCHGQRPALEREAACAADTEVPQWPHGGACNLLLPAMTVTTQAGQQVALAFAHWQRSMGLRGLRGSSDSSSNHRSKQQLVIT